MNDETLKALGKLVPPGVERDAVHIAVVPVVAGVDLDPGEHVGICGDKACTLQLCNGIAVGIADPFLTRPVKAGERFWLFLYPGSVTSMRHQWGHPAFPMSAGAVGQSEAWLRELCQEVEFPYEQLVETVKTGFFSTGADDDASYSLNTVADGPRGKDFIRHLEVVTGRRLDGYVSFSCSC